MSPRKSRVVHHGNCYVCGRPCWSSYPPRRASATLYRKGGLLRDENGVRHGDHVASAPGTVTPSDA